MVTVIFFVLIGLDEMSAILGALTYLKHVLSTASNKPLSFNSFAIYDLAGLSSQVMTHKASALNWLGRMSAKTQIGATPSGDMGGQVKTGSFLKSADSSS